MGDHLRDIFDELFFEAIVKSQLATFVLEGKHDFAAVLKRLMVAAGVYTQADFARILDVSPTAVISARRRNKIPPDWIETISEKFGVSIESLVYGEDTYENKGGELLAVAPNEFINVPWVEGRLVDCVERLVENSKPPKMLAFKRSWIQHKGNEKDLVLTEVMGEAMEPVLYDGDLVLVDLSKTDVREGKIFAVAYDGTIYIKRIFTEPGKWVLKSENKDFKDVIIDWRDASVAGNVKMVGKVVWWCHDE